MEGGNPGSVYASLPSLPASRDAEARSQGRDPDGHGKVAAGSNATRLTGRTRLDSITFVITSGVPMHTLKLTQIGNSVGAVFPKELLARLNLEKGDEFYVTETPDGMRITTHNPEFEAQMRVAREIMKERRDVLHELAK
jgi:putative addiction module antidote